MKILVHSAGHHESEAILGRWVLLDQERSDSDDASAFGLDRSNRERLGPTLIDDRQFIASMIPHYSGAILMCREANLSDPELVTLCGDITKTQRDEIQQMEQIAGRLR